MFLLPQDLLPVVFANLSKDELCECMKVCRSWYPEASALLYKEVSLVTKFNKNLLELVETTRIDGSKLGNFVKKIYFRFSYDYDDLQEDEFQRLIYSLPKLRIIIATEKYIQYLDSMPSTKLMSLQEVSMNDQYIEQKVLDPHFNVNTRLRSNITTLKLTSLNISSLIGNMERLINILPEFKQLKHLTIGSHRERNSDRNCINLTSILNACSRLVSLNLRSECHWNSNTEKQAIHTNLTSLRLEILYFKQEHMEYIMHHLPNLTDFTLRVQEEYFEGVLAAVDPIVLKKFATYLRKIKRVEILPVWPIRISSLDRETVYSQVATFWGFMRDVCSKGHYACNLKAEIAYATPIKTKFKKENQHLCLTGDIALDIDNPDYWIHQIDFLTFNRIDIRNRHKDIQLIRPSFKRLQLEDGYLYLVQPLLKLLLRQEQTCVLCVKNVEQLLLFDFHSPNNEEENGSVIKYGNMVGFILKEEMVKDLCQLYPTIETLTLERCIFEKDDRDLNLYCLDLSGFVDLYELTLDIDAMVEQRIVEPKMYIKFIKKMTPNLCDAFLYDQNALSYLGELNQLDIPQAFSLIEICHSQIKRFTLGGTTMQMNRSLP